MIAVFSSSIKQEKSSEIMKVEEILASVSKEITEVVIPTPNNTVPKSPKGRKGKKEEEARMLEEQERLQREAEDSRKLMDRQREITRILKEQAATHNLYVTCPNGVHLSFKHGLFIEDFEKLDCPNETFFLKQQLFSNHREKVTLENHDVVKELHRCVTECGMVVKVTLEIGFIFKKKRPSYLKGNMSIKQKNLYVL